MAAPQFSDGLEPQRGGQVVAHAHMAVLGCMGRAQAAAPDAEIWIRIRASIAPDAQGRPALSTPELSASAGAPAELIDCARANLTARKIPIPPDTKGTFEVQFRPPPRGTPKRAVRKPIVKED